MEERQVIGFPAYVVREDGVVARSRDGKVIQPQSRDGYMRVQLHLSGKRYWRTVHAIVLEAFVGPRPSVIHHGAHGDGNRTNNAVRNLTWKLPVENEQDKRLHGTAPSGFPERRLDKKDVQNIRRRLRRGGASNSYSRIATAYGLHRHSVSRIARGLRWNRKRKRRLPKPKTREKSDLTPLPNHRLITLPSTVAPDRNLLAMALETGIAGDEP